MLPILFEIIFHNEKNNIDNFAGHIYKPPI